MTDHNPFPMAPVGERIAKGAEIRLVPSDYDETSYGMTVCSMVFDGEGFSTSEYDCAFLSLRVESADELGAVLESTINRALHDWRGQEASDE